MTNRLSLAAVTSQSSEVCLKLSITCIQVSIKPCLARCGCLSGDVQFQTFLTAESCLFKATHRSQGIVSPSSDYSNAVTLLSIDKDPEHLKVNEHFGAFIVVVFRSLHVAQRGWNSQRSTCFVVLKCCWEKACATAGLP